MLGDSNAFQTSIDRARQALDRSSPELGPAGHDDLGLVLRGLQQRVQVVSRCEIVELHP